MCTHSVDCFRRYLLHLAVLEWLPLFNPSQEPVSSEVTDATVYGVQFRTGGTEAGWISLAETWSTSQEYSPEGGPLCRTTYEFHARARGWGGLIIAKWGEPSQVVSHSTGACNVAPEFNPTIIIHADRCLNDCRLIASNWVTSSPGSLVYSNRTSHAGSFVHVS